MVEPNPRDNKENSKNYQSESNQVIGNSFFEIETHSQEFLSSLESEIANNQYLSQNSQKQLLQEVHSSMQTTIHNISIEINQSGEIQTETQEFIYICEQMHQRYDGLSTRTINIAMGQYIARHEPSRYRQVSSYLSNLQIDTSQMLVSALRSSRRRNLNNVAIELISSHQEIPEQYLPEIQEQTINIIQNTPEVLTHDISHIFEGNEDLLLENLETKQLFSTSLNLFLNLKIIECIIEKKLEQLNKIEDPKQIIQEISVIENFNEELALILAERICETKSNILEEYISKQINKQQTDFNPEVLYLVASFCRNYPQFIFERLNFSLNENLHINIEVLDYFLSKMFKERNFLTCEFFIQNLKYLDQNSKTQETFLKNIYIESFHSLTLFHDLPKEHKVISLNILLKSYKKSSKNIFLYQIKLITESFTTTRPLTQKEEKEIIEILQQFPELTNLFKNETKNLIKKGFYLIPLNIIKIEKPTAEKYSFLINQIQIEKLDTPSNLTIEKLPTDYFSASVEYLGNLKNKLQLSTQKMESIVSYLKKVQKIKDPNTNFEGYEDEISQIYN
ncbi:hypothetical protein HOJ01_03010 [bacterium]|jgi:hypothetical protein|nr:hypothetical protein [bacterium]MBT6293754.1 hypothetical protein [bacterium]